MSETFLGRALVSRRPRDSFFLATKLPVWEIDSPAAAEALFARQRAKLCTDYIDFYLLHSLDGARFTQLEQAGLYDWARDQQKAGKIRHLGFSFHGTIADLERIIAAHAWDFAQIQLNYLDWDLQHAGRAAELLREAAIPIIVMEPVRGGTLAALPDSAEQLLKSADSQASPASWALRFAASVPGVLTVLSGMSTVSQVEENSETLGRDFRPLNQSEYATLAEALVALQAAGTIPCTACRYCMDCPFGVDIPRVFAFYNQYKLTHNSFSYQLNLDILGKQAQAAQCSACGQCLDRCPQHIDIPTQMGVVAHESALLQGVDEFRAKRAKKIAQREGGIKTGAPS
jgi:predicted aldo/keto reductase-like oxidoreductase